MDMPACCGKMMNVSLECDNFVEMHCERCDDVIFVKKRDY